MTRKVFLTALLLALVVLPWQRGGATGKDEGFKRGVTISCWGWGREWAEPGMGEAMKEIRGLGGTWISFHPYAWIRNNGQIRHRNSSVDSTVLKPLAEAKKRGLKVLLKPHIGYWGSQFSWRGAITFDNEESWKRFFKGYEDFIVTQAKMAEAGGAGMFCVGLEYKGTTHREKEWRAIIKAVRKVYKGPVTYAANWDNYQRVKFWDALDAIGIQAYFPISQKPMPSEADLQKGWKPVLATLKAFSATHKKPIILTELGYNRSSQAAAKPWEYSEGGPGAETLKLRCMKVALKEIETCEAIKGVFLWKWFPTTRDLSRNFMLQYDPMRAILREAWSSTRPGPKEKQKF